MGRLMDAFKSGLGGQVYDPEENNQMSMEIMRQHELMQQNYKKLMEGTTLQKTRPTPAHPQREDSFEQHPISMISMRLHLKSGDYFPLPHIDAYLGPNCAIVFVVTKDHKAVIIEDDSALFPSDTLITQLRLLIG